MSAGAWQCAHFRGDWNWLDIFPPFLHIVHTSGCLCWMQKDGNRFCIFLPCFSSQSCPYQALTEPLLSPYQAGLGAEHCTFPCWWDSVPCTGSVPLHLESSGLLVWSPGVAAVLLGTAGVPAMAQLTTQLVRAGARCYLMVPVTEFPPLQCLGDCAVLSKARCGS